MNYRYKISRRLSLNHLSRSLALLGAASCAQGEKREFLGPPDPRPTNNSLAAVVITPRIGTIQPSELIAFAAYGRNAKGDSIGVDVNWSASGGTVSSTGQFTATAPASYWVVARSNAQADKADSATVVVLGQDNPITRLTVSPKIASVRLGQSRQFSASAYFPSGAPAAVPIFWSVSGGNIDPNGLYTPDQTGQFVVIAVVGS